VRTRLRPGEEIVTLVRRHWVTLAGPFGLTLFFAGCLVAAWLAGRPALLPVAGAALLASGAWALWRWLDWRADLWAVTGQRVIDESGVLAVRMVDSPLDTIHNVILEQSILGRMMGYGTLNVQTGAAHGSTTITDVAWPGDLREAIMEMKERYRNRLPGAAAAGAIADGGSAMGAAAPPGTGTKECPYCAEIIKVKATVCRFCGRNL